MQFPLHNVALLEFYSIDAVWIKVDNMVNSLKVVFI